MEQIFYFCALVVLMAVSCTRASVTFDVRMIRFGNSAGETADGESCDGFWAGDCENKFTFCLDRVRSPINTDTGSCSIGRYITGEFREADSVSFGTSMEGVQNPIQAQISSADTVVLKVRIVDVDVQFDDLVDTMYGELWIPSVGRGGSAQWTQARLTGRRRSSKTYLTLEYRAYCRSNYYGPNCDVHCVRRDSDSDGHYTCDQDTGQKLCMEGWIDPASSCKTVEPCPTHIRCQHGGTCELVRGISTCVCMPEYTGTRCETALVCLRRPCQNGAQCSLSGNSYRCACPAQFTGSRCELEIGDPCDSGNCLDRGTCSIAPAGGYSCSCTDGYTGPRCEVEIPDPCDAEPCLNSGVCSTTPEGYFCVCANGYTGERCQEDVTCDGDCNNEVCNNGDCHNGGSCVVSGECLCTPCYTGPRCDTYVCDTSICKERNPMCSDEDSGKDTLRINKWILIGASLGFVCFIVLIIVCICLCRKRKRSSRNTRNRPEARAPANEYNYIDESGLGPIKPPQTPAGDYSCIDESGLGPIKPPKTPARNPTPAGTIDLQYMTPHVAPNNAVYLHTVSDQVSATGDENFRRIYDGYLHPNAKP